MKDRDEGELPLFEELDARDQELPPVPVGIEHLMAMAAVDEAFAEALYRDRHEVAEASGVTLSAAEQAILSAIGEGQLRQMVASVDDAIPDTDRRSFLGRSAAALLVLAGGGMAASSGGCSREGSDRSDRFTKGIRADRPASPAGKPRPVTPAGKPRPAEPAENRAPDSSFVPDAGRPPAADPGPGARARRGARPKRPPQNRRAVSKGIRPDRRRPKPRLTRGIRPDIPDNLFDDDF